MLLPLGPDLVEPLGMRTDELPILVGAGTTSAALAGVFGGGWLERAPRRGTLVGLLGVLVVAQLLAASATGWPMMLVARLLSGAAGGQAGALGLVMLSDEVPDARRGRAIGSLMAANGLAAILGVPLALWSAQHLGWQAPFLLVAAGALVAGGLAAGLLPTMRRPGPVEGSRLAPLASGRAVGALGLTVLVVASSFLINPNLSAFLQFNLGLPREDMPWMYGLAGSFALVATQLTGRAVDRWGSARVGAVAALVYVGVVLTLVVGEGGIPVMLGFILLLSSLQSRNVSVRSLATRAPRPEQRGRFMSLLSTSQQLGAAAGAGVSSLMLTTQADGRLEGMPAVGLLSVGLVVGMLPLLVWVERATAGSTPGEG